MCSKGLDLSWEVVRVMYGLSAAKISEQVRVYQASIIKRAVAKVVVGYSTVRSLAFRTAIFSRID